MIRIDDGWGIDRLPEVWRHNFGLSIMIRYVSISKILSAFLDGVFYVS